ncbi:MAG: M14 family zinc carboxypeptidase [Geothrix sp.]|nr:M14 family zinc carboxypeptidase [Geothrix sp.]
MTLRLPLCLLVLCASLPASAPAPGAPWGAQSLWDAWPQARVAPADPWSLKHAGLRQTLDGLQARHPGLLTLVEEGLSAEGRKIPLLRVGTGPTGILLWSQMHGDEPTATAALLDALNWLGTHRQDAAVKQFLSRVTLWIIPMLNPDGAERTQRWNAQGIDINRDALRLSTPEGRYLKAVRDRLRPALGYNLHNQNPLLRAGRAGSQAAISVLSVPGDEADSGALGTRKTRQLALEVQRLVQALAPGRVARYDTDYTARAFGDSMTRWGTPTLLIETGGWGGPGEAGRLVRLNFVALLGSLAAVADGSFEAMDPADYGRIPLNQRDALGTLVVRNTRLASGRGFPPFVADLSFVIPGAFAGEAIRRLEPGLVELGDLADFKGVDEFDAAGMLAVPWPTQPETGWASLREALQARGLVETDEATLLAAARALGEAAVARSGFTGAVLLYRTLATGRLKLEGAVLRGQLAGLPTPRQGVSKPSLGLNGGNQPDVNPVKCGTPSAAPG